MKLEKVTVYPPEIPSTPEGWAACPEADKGIAYWWWCCGCETHHLFRTKAAKNEKNYKGEEVPIWTFNENLEKPTFSPSLLYRWHNDTLNKDEVCHLFLIDGELRYLGDCTHRLASRTVLLGEVI